jgi:hypothetical protein
VETSGQALRRWAPLIAVAAVQVLLVAVVPSRGDVAGGADALLGGGAPLSVGGGSGTGAVDPVTGQPLPAGSAGGVDPVTGQPIPAGTSGSGSTAGASGTAGGSGVPGAPGTTGGTVPGQPNVPVQSGPADLSKCAKGGKLQQDVTSASPPCTPRFTGDNGGATYQGVSKDKIKIIRYRPKSNEQVDAILRTQGLAFSTAEEKEAMDTYAKFFEKRYEFYDRKVEWIFEQGTCNISPPDLPCFRNEAKRLNAKHKPFGIFWTNSTTQAEFFDEWSRLGVVNAGGWHFNSQFNNALRPFHWDVFMDGTRTATNIADYWCKKMQGKNATLAGDPALRTKKRKLGILTQAFPVTQKNALDLYAMVTGGKCGTKADAAEPVYTPSDIAQGQQTANVAVQKLKAEGVTTLVIISDPINPTFTTTAATRQQWFPEHLLAGSGVIDFDPLGRLYDQSQWRNAFGPGHLADPAPPERTDSFKAAADVGVRDNGAGALIFAYMNLFSTMIQRSGPDLKPLNVERGMHTLPPQGGWEATKNPLAILLKYGPGDYTAIEDSRHTFWDPNATSKIDGKPGAYVALEGGRRFEIGKWPAGEPRR